MGGFAEIRIQTIIDDAYIRLASETEDLILYILGYGQKTMCRLDDVESLRCRLMNLIGVNVGDDGSL